MQSVATDALSKYLAAGYTQAEAEELLAFDAEVDREFDEGLNAALADAYMQRDMDADLDELATLDALDHKTAHARKRSKKYQRQYYEANKDQIAEYQRHYREANKDQIAEYQRHYREANKDQIAEQRRHYREANKDQIALRNKDPERAEKRRAYLREYMRVYRRRKKEAAAHI